MSPETLSQVEAYWTAVHAGAPVVELRALGTSSGTLVGRYTDVTNFASAVQSIPSGNVYAPIQQIDNQQIAGQNKPPARGSAVNDDQIARYRSLPLDIDPIRRAPDGTPIKGVAATTEEMNHALNVGRKVFTHLQTKFGVDAVVIHSGNGCYVLPPIDLPNTPDSRLLVERAVAGLGAKFNTPDAHFDTTACNQSRILGVPGTMNVKGPSTAERPHRMRKLLRAGSRDRVLTREQLVLMAQDAPPEVVPTERSVADVLKSGLIANDKLKPEWVDSFLESNNVGHSKRTPYKDGWRWILDECPFNARHTTEDRDGHVAVIQKASGMICFVCQHHSCLKTPWSEFRKTVEILTSIPAQTVMDPDSVAAEWAIREAFAENEKDRAQAQEVETMVSTPNVGLDFVKQYAKCNDRFEASIELHELIAIATLAAIANRNNVTFDYCARPTPMDLWLTALLPSGGGKNESLRVMREMVFTLTHLFSNTNWGSPEYFYEDLAGSPDRTTARFWVFTEAAELFGKLNQSRWTGVKPFLTDLFDSSNIPAAIKHRTNKKGDPNTPDITFSSAPRTNMLMMSGMDWYVEQLKSTDACSGFLARYIPVVLPDSKRLVHFVTPPDERLWNQLIAKLVRISQLSGPADISRFYSSSGDCPYAKWYEETSKRWTSKGTVANIFFKRWRVFVLKLAVVFEMSQSETLKVSLESFQRAAAWLQKLESIVFKLAEDEFSGEALRLHRKEKFFRAAGTTGVSPGEYTRKYRGERPGQRRKEDLTTLLEMGAVYKVGARVGAKGENIPEGYVHADFVKVGAT